MEAGEGRGELFNGYKVPVLQDRLLVRVLQREREIY